MLEAMKKLFKRISEDEMINFIDRAERFVRMGEIDPEADLVRNHLLAA
jgi:hypothetical protein